MEDEGESERSPYGQAGSLKERKRQPLRDESTESDEHSGSERGGRKGPEQKKDKE